MSQILIEMCIIGYFTSFVGFRKYPLTKLDAMIRTNTVNNRELFTIISVLIISLIGAILIALYVGYVILVIFLSQVHINIILLLKNIVILFLTIVWYKSFLKPIITKLDLILGKD